MTLGRRIKQLRLQQRLTQSALAKAVQMRQPLLSLVETDKQGYVHSDVLLRLATVLGCTTDYLVGRFAEDLTDTERMH